MLKKDRFSFRRLASLVFLRSESYAYQIKHVVLKILTNIIGIYKGSHTYHSEVYKYISVYEKNDSSHTLTLFANFPGDFLAFYCLASLVFM